MVILLKSQTSTGSSVRGQWFGHCLSGLYIVTVLYTIGKREFNELDFSGVFGCWYDN